MILIFSGQRVMVGVESGESAAEIRTRDGGFADLCLTTWLRRHGERSSHGFSGRGKRIGHCISLCHKGQADVTQRLASRDLASTRDDQRIVIDVPA